MCVTDSPSTLHLLPSKDSPSAQCTCRYLLHSPNLPSLVTPATDARPALYLQVDQLYCLAMHCNVKIQNSKTQTIILKILFWFFGLMNPFPARVQNLLASRQRGGMKSREVKQSREIKQNQTKQRSQTKSNKALPKEESWILSQRPRKCRLPAMHLNLAFDSTLDLPLFVLLHFYMYLIFSNVFFSFF